MGRLLLALAVALCGVPAAGHSAATMRGANTVSGKPASTYPGRPARQATGFETLFYLRNNDQAIRSFADNAQHISIIGPQTFNISAAGELRGRVDPRILEIARANDVSVMPLFLNPGFDQQIVHQLLDDPAARDRAVLALVDLAVAHDFWGWQFDLENIHQSYRDRLTDFYRQAAEALHAAGKTISIAVVPTDGSAGSDPFSTYMQENWRNSFDVAALAEIGDFVSWMTYAQHAGGTTPGPVAGLPWMREMMDAVLAQGVAPEKISLGVPSYSEMMDWVLAQGVAPEKISLGVPSYSDYWLPTHSEASGARVRGRDISFTRANELADAAGAEWMWSAEQGVYYTFWQRNVTFDWIFREDARSFGLKLDLVREHERLRGISVWVLGTEDPEIWDVLARRRSFF